MTTPQRSSTIVPAQLAFLAIYNPSLGGESDESFRDQLVFYHSRAALEARVAARKYARDDDDAAGGDRLRAEENEKLRQIGLAQGMVDFAKTFSNGVPVDSIETEKSRVVLSELEKGWWILASIDLTRLPALAQSSTTLGKSASEISGNEAVAEYSSREVSPAALLIQQLLQAHYIFNLHHGPSLDELFVRLTRDKFCTILDRFWTRFARNWDILLHGLPAADVFSGIKLASGGELGFGVGEEEWGSGEREVLEDLVRRTDGLVDLVVARYGDSAFVEEDISAMQHDNALPWLGSGSQPNSSDGIVFGGIGAVQRHSLRNLSLWLRQIYIYGDKAYAVRDNPLRERRKRRRPSRGNGEAESKHVSATQADRVGEERGESRQKQTRNKIEASSGRNSTEDVNDPSGTNDHAVDSTKLFTEPYPSNHQAIPPPIVASTGRAREQESDPVETASENTNALGIPEIYMKYLTFGLSTLGKQKRPNIPTEPSKSDTSRVRPHNQSKISKAPANKVDERNTTSSLAQVELIPEQDTMKARIATQIRRENRGHFVIGLKGDLLELDELSEDDHDDVSDGSLEDDADGSRIVLRTLMVEAVPSVPGNESEESSFDIDKTALAPIPPAFSHYRRVRVLVYVHRPFMYCFLFENRTSSLQYTSFYKSLHRSLAPIHKPLLSSTNPTKVAQRIALSRAPAEETAETSSTKSSSKSTAPATNSSPIYELIYDPKRMTLHTSIPNIPEPGTLAAEGIFTSLTPDSTPLEASSWTRVEALNVHSQILSTLTNIRDKPGELERTSKTSRGWWIVWLKIPPSPTATVPSTPAAVTIASTSTQQPAENSTLHAPTTIGGDKQADMHRIAFLVRKASDATVAPRQTSTGASRAMSSMLEVMSLGMAASREDDATGGTGAGWGPAALAGGIGIDARAYVEGLLSLNR